MESIEETKEKKVRPKKKDTLGKIYFEGIWKNNPVLIMLLGLCPALATSSSALDGLGMGVATTFVLTLSNFVVSLIRGIIPNKMRIPSFIVVIATFVTVVDYLMQAYTPALSRSLGLFIPLIVVNCTILGRAESFAYKKGVFHSINDGLAMGIGFTLTLVVMGAVREIFGSGSLFGVSLFGEGFNPVLFMVLPPGAFLTLGYLLALSNYINKKVAEKKAAEVA